MEEEEEKVVVDKVAGDMEVVVDKVAGDMEEEEEKVVVQ
jgi:hypothetical protein